MEALAVGVPVEMTQTLDLHRLEMRSDGDLRCIALVGQIGLAAHCRIYAQRPNPCRELGAAFENGEPSPQCERARARHGLPPLTPADWLPALA